MRLSFRQTLYDNAHLPGGNRHRSATSLSPGSTVSQVVPPLSATAVAAFCARGTAAGSEGATANVWGRAVTAGGGSVPPSVGLSAAARCGTQGKHRSNCRDPPRLPCPCRKCREQPLHANSPSSSSPQREQDRPSRDAPLGRYKETRLPDRPLPGVRAEGKPLVPESSPEALEQTVACSPEA